MQETGEREWAQQRLQRWRASREPEALGQLLKWQRDRAYATALRILGNGADAEDAVQQACIKLLSRTHGFDTLDQFKVTVYRAVVQCALDMARANRVRAKLEKAMSPLERPATLPQLAAEQAEALKLVWQELQAMPEDSRALVVLCYQEGLSVSDAAEALDVPRETLRDRLAASMAELRKKLSQRGVMLSLLVIAGLLKHGSAEAAPVGLCEALDIALPGQPCAEIPAAKAPAAAPELASGPSTVSPHSFSKTIGLGMAASLLIGAGIWFALDAATAPKPATPRVLVAASSSTNAPGSSDSNVDKSAPRAVAMRPSTTTANGVQVAAPTPAPIATPAPKPDATARAAKKNNAEKDEPIALAQVPAAVRATAEKALAGVVLKEAELKNENKKVLYEIKGEAGGKNFDILVRDDGTLIKVTPDDDNDEDEAKKPVPPPAPPKSEF